MKTDKKSSKKFNKAYILLIIGILILGYSGYRLFDYFWNINKAEQAFNNLKDMIQEEPTEPGDAGGNPLTTRTKPDFSALLDANSDFVGWITVPDTRIDYPVMQTPNNEEFYLRRNFEKQYDMSGTPFCNADADLVRPSDNIIIYGHHMSAGTMFHDLVNYKKKDFYTEHKTFYFDTIYRTGTYEVIAVCLVGTLSEDDFPYWTVVNCNEEEFNEYISWLKSKSLYTTDSIDNTKYGDRLVTLSTCEYHVEGGRLIVVGKLIDSDDIDLLNK